MLHQVQAGLIYDHAGDAKNAAASLLAAIDATIEIPAQLAELYVALMLRQGNGQAARDMVERYRAQAQGRGEDVASAMLRRIDDDKGKGPLVADVKQGLAIAYGQMAMELMADDFNGDALWLMQLALDLDPKLDIARVALGDLYRQIKRWDAAIAAYSQVERRFDLSPAGAALDRRMLSPAGEERRGRGDAAPGDGGRPDRHLGGPTARPVAAHDQGFHRCRQGLQHRHRTPGNPGAGGLAALLLSRHRL